MTVTERECMADAWGEIPDVLGGRWAASRGRPVRSPIPRRRGGLAHVLVEPPPTDLLGAVGPAVCCGAG
ncbi:hypothetical protein [Nakamurella leprariae]|uniref:Uncharacterized protein n=1 Tax=Nakamurella leprariae TaxID=2803911 RepID=A0A938YF26_9ACTN|nr:hypothetical protein [Nakamurella leprariae]MBM9466979.1 hypothetical protein [Nakamurella leprariae]